VTLRVEAEVTVRGEEISLGDLATVAGDEDLASRLRQVRLGPAPAPGGSQRIDPDYLRQRLSELRVLLEHAAHPPGDHGHARLPDGDGGGDVGRRAGSAQERLARSHVRAHAVTAFSRPADLRVPVGTVRDRRRRCLEPPAQGAMGAEVTGKVDGRSYRTMPLS
jgi:hypothetical protein